MKILGLFLGWRIFLFLVSILAIFVIPEFGSSFPYFDTELMTTGLPDWVWSFGNFDGVHYLRLARLGYEGSRFSQAFFPLYPALISLFNAVVNNLFLSALILSNLFLGAALFILYRLFRLDYNCKTSLRALVLLLAFPTAFYFGAIYTESLFLLLVVTSLLFIRKGNFLIGGIFAALASATKVIGVLLFPVMLIELFIVAKEKKWNWKSKEMLAALIGIIFAPLGLFFYMVYLKSNFNDPLLFLNSQIVWEGRSTQSFVTLPQVFFRYFKVFLTVPINSLSFFNALLEFIFTIFPLGILLLAIKKIRFSYAFFTAGCLIVPTLTGTLLSMPRFSLISFLIFPFIVSRLNKGFGICIFCLAVLEAIFVILFTRGYWIA